MKPTNPPDTAIPERLASLRARIAAACRRAGRDPASVRLLAASKTMPPERVVEAFEAGQRLFGENRAQELRDKRAAVDRILAERGIGDRPEWHFIGHLQRNKARIVAPIAGMVHAVDGLELARELGRRAARAGTAPLPVLVEVNLAGEATKAGVAPAEALDLCRAVAAVDGLALRGLMAIPPRVERPEDARPWFRRLAELAARGRAEGLPLVELSMGMSADFEAAIAEGATIVRVGTALFGPRPAN